MGLQAPATPRVDTALGIGGRRKLYPWIVFALAFGLLLSDYMSRQVLSAVFPILKADWDLSDSHLASLSSVVALMVGLLTFPLSLLADRWGRVKSLILMAVLWSVATLLCAIAQTYEQMLGARFLVGVGEAAYGSVGIAVVLSVFAPRVHAALAGAFMAGGSFGSVIGVAIGGFIAVQFSWRWSFAAMAIFGLILVALFRALVTEKKLTAYAVEAAPDAAGEAVRHDGFRAPVSSLFTNPAVLFAYIGGGLQMFTAAVLLAWLPSFFNRYYDLAPDKAGVTASVFVLLVGSGMVVCGFITDRFSRDDSARKWTTAIVYCAISLVTLSNRAPVRHGDSTTRVARYRCILLRRFVGADGSYGREPYPSLDSSVGHGDAHRCQQPSRAGARPLRCRHPRRSPGSSWRSTAFALRLCRRGPRVGSRQACLSRRDEAAGDVAESARDPWRY